MGYMYAFGLAEMTDLRTAISAHLSSNCFPPVPSVMVDPAEIAVRNCVEGDSDTLVRLPDGIAFRDGRSEVQSWVIIDSLRLDAFVDALTNDEGEF